MVFVVTVLTVLVVLQLGIDVALTAVLVVVVVVLQVTVDVVAVGRYVCLFSTSEAAAEEWRSTLGDVDVLLPTVHAHGSD